MAVAMFGMFIILFTCSLSLFFLKRRYQFETLWDSFRVFGRTSNPSKTSLSTLFLVTGVLVYPYMTYLLFITEVRGANEAEPRLNRSPLSFEPTVAVPRSHP